VANKSKKYIFESDPSETTDVSSNIRIIVVTNLKDFRSFYQVPWMIYKDDEYWVPAFWKESRDFFKSDNLFWKHSEARLFLAFKNDVAVGRVAAIIDHNLPKENEEEFIRVLDQLIGETLNKK